MRKTKTALWEYSIEVDYYRKSEIVYQESWYDFSTVPRNEAEVVSEVKREIEEAPDYETYDLVTFRCYLQEHLPMGEEDDLKA